MSSQRPPPITVAPHQPPPTPPPSCQPQSTSRPLEPWRLPAPDPPFNPAQQQQQQQQSFPPAPPPPRKRQFRFSVRADIDLLRLVQKLNPYAAPHGGRLHKWQSIADTLRAGGIDIDFRRARDRTALLLEQWREQDLSLLRRSGSGNHHHQAEKERLLESISQIELAAKPRDNLPDWRLREHTTARLRAQQAANAAAAAVASATASNFFQAPSTTLPPATAPGNLPPLLQKPVANPSAPAPPDPAAEHPSTLPFAAPLSNHHLHHHPPVLPGPPEKHFKPNPTSVPNISISAGVGGSRFHQPLFSGPSAPIPAPNSPSLPRPKSNAAASSTTAYRPSPDMSLPLLRHSPGATNTPAATHASPANNTPAPAFDVSAAAAAEIQHAVSAVAEPSGGEPNSASAGGVPLNQNTQLFPVALPGPAGGAPEQLRWRVERLERRLDDVIDMSKKRLDYDERRLVWDKEKECKRLQIEQERILKEFEERKAEREERRQREIVDKEERDRILKIILNARDPTLSEGDNNA